MSNDGFQVFINRLGCLGSLEFKSMYSKESPNFREAPKIILFHNQIQFPNAFEKACPMNYSILIDRELQKKLSCRWTH